MLNFYSDISRHSLISVFSVLVSLSLFSAATYAVTPNPLNSVDVDVKPMSNAPQMLNLFIKGRQVKVIEIPQTKQFVRFSFPSNYSQADIRVFTSSETAAKQKILDSYATDPNAGLALFDSLWSGGTSSGGSLKCPLQSSNSAPLMLCINRRDRVKMVDDFLLKVTYADKTFLFNSKRNDVEETNPQIRNRTR